MTDKERLLKEVSLMLTFSHPNVMPLIGLSFDEETPLIIMPFMSNGTVRKAQRFVYSCDLMRARSLRNDVTTIDPHGPVGYELFLANLQDRF